MIHLRQFSTTLAFITFFFSGAFLFAQSDSTEKINNHTNEHLIAIDGSVMMPVFYKFAHGFGSYNVADGNVLKKRSWIPDYNFRLSYLHYTKKPLGFGGEVSINLSRVQASGWLRSTFTGYTHGKLESLFTQSYAVVPKMEWKKHANRLPFGIAHQVGLGITLSRVIKKDYVFVPDPDPNDFDVDYNTLQLMDYDRARFLGLTLFYQFNARMKITEKFLCNVGFRVTANYQFTGYGVSDIYSIDNQGYWMSRAEVAKVVAQKRTTSFFTPNIGIGYLF